MKTDLLTTEIVRLAALEDVISTGHQAFRAVGQALIEIRESKLYRASYPSFDAYCTKRWDFSASRARQLIGAAHVVEQIESVTAGNTLPSERHARALRPLLEAQGPEAVGKMLDSLGPKTTAKQLEQAVKKELRAKPVAPASIACGDEGDDLPKVAPAIRAFIEKASKQAIGELVALCNDRVAVLAAKEKAIPFRYEPVKP